jgi:hypothetical protein
MELLDSQRETVRLGAIRTVFENAQALRKIVMIESRLAELERRASIA